MDLTQDIKAVRATIKELVEYVLILEAHWSVKEGPIFGYICPGECYDDYYTQLDDIDLPDDFDLDHVNPAVSTPYGYCYDTGSGNIVIWLSSGWGLVYWNPYIDDIFKKSPHLWRNWVTSIEEPEGLIQTKKPVVLV